MTREEIQVFAIKNGYAGAKKIGCWHGYEVYQPYFEGKKPHFVGPPLDILVSKDEIRMTSVEESFEILSSVR